MSVLASLFLLVSCAQKKDVDLLEARIKTLEEKIATLDKKPGVGASTANPEEEEAATVIMRDAMAAQKAGDFATAKLKFAEVKDKYASTRAAKTAARMAAEVNIIGTDVAHIETEKWFVGKADYADSKATLLVFWEAWCPHCKKELPKLVAKEADYKKRGMQVVGLTKVTRSATDDKVMELIKEHNVKFPVGKEKEESMSRTFNVSGVPAAAIVKDGKIAWRGHPMNIDDALLDRVLAGS
jgi:peroxiredoxin